MFKTLKYGFQHNIWNFWKRTNLLWIFKT